MMVSWNSDTARYSNRNISPVSLKMAVLMSSSQMKARLRYSSLFVNVYKHLCINIYKRTFMYKRLKMFINQTTVKKL